MKIIIDTDIGTDIDDAFALALALRAGLHLVGVSTVSGNTIARARIARKMLLQEQQNDVPVFAGMDSGRGLSYDSWASDIDASMIVHDMNALIEFYWHAIEQNRNGGLRIIGIGPLTNIVAIRERDPLAFDDRVSLLLMAGSIHKGYLGIKLPFPEYNIVMDKAAARTLFESRVSLSIVPLDVTADLKLDNAGLARFEAVSGTDPLIKGLLDMTAMFRARSRRMPVLFDPGTIATIVDGHLAKFTDVPLRISRLGYTRIIKDKVQDVVDKRVCLEFNKQRFYNLFFSTLLGDNQGACIEANASSSIKD